jgi:hypothetical protein
MPSDTPQHAIRDGEFRLVYVTGNKGLYKYFPDTNQILMFKPAGEGNQGHMAGYAGYGGPPKGIMELIVTNYEVSTAADAPIGTRHVPDVGWLRFGLSNSLAPGVKRWTSPSSNRFNPDELLVLAHETWGLNVSEGKIVGSGPTCQVCAGPTCDEAKIWYSPDGGENWVPFLNVTLNLPSSIAPTGTNPGVTFRAHKIMWDHVVDGRWAMVGAFDNMYWEDGYSHAAYGLMLVVGDRTGNAHMWLRPTPNVVPNNAVYGLPNWPHTRTQAVAWSWADPDPDTGFHKIVIGFQINYGGKYQFLLAETSIPGPTGTSWTPAYSPPYDVPQTHMTEGLAQAHNELLEHRRGTLEVYQATSNTQTTWTSPMENIGGEILWQSNYMEPTPGLRGSHWEYFMPGVKLGNEFACAADALYVGGHYGTAGAGGIFRIPYGSTSYDAVVSVPGTEGREIGAVVADDQHRTYVAAFAGSTFSGAVNVFVFDGDTWGYIEMYDADERTRPGGLAIINRTPL